MAVKKCTRRDSAARVPQYVEDLCQLARDAGFSVSVRCGSGPDSRARGLEDDTWFREAGIWLQWIGSAEQLQSLNLLPPSYRPPRPGYSGVISIRPCLRVDRDRPYLFGWIKNREGDLLLELYGGPAPKTIRKEGAIEICEFAGEIAFHGPLAQLLDRGILDPAKLPSEKRMLKSKFYRLDYLEVPAAPYWITRRQPDGSYVHYVETEPAFQLRKESMEKEVERRNRERERNAVYQKISKEGIASVLVTADVCRRYLRLALIQDPKRILASLADLTDPKNTFNLSQESLERINECLDELDATLAEASIYRIKRDERSEEAKERARNSVAEAQSDANFQRFMLQLRPPAAS